jgi:hypothetical protein
MRRYAGPYILVDPHKEYARSQVPIKAALQSSSASASVDRQVTVAEMYFATFIAEHNLPFAASDHFSKLCKVMFPDSEIAKKFSSGRTKKCKACSCSSFQ